MSDETYNGWRNVETWRVQLHLTNDESEIQVVSAIAELYLTRPRLSEISEGHYPPTFSQFLRERVETETGCASVGGSLWEMFSRDVVQAALVRVDWEQIAAHWLDATRLELAQKAAK
jgi:hypothetical protein